MNATHLATLNGETLECNADNYQATIEALMAKHPGAGVPRVVAIAPAATDATIERAIAVLATPTPATVTVAVATPTPSNAPAPVVGSGSVCIVGAARAQADFDRAVAAGFAPRQPLFTRGTRVNSTGVDNARKSRAAWAAMPLIHDLCADFIDQIAREERTDLPAVPTGDLRMDKMGQLALPNGRRIAMTHRALEGLTARVKTADGSPIGGASYLAKCKPELRAINVNHHTRDMAEREAAAATAAAAEGKDSPERALTVVGTRKVLDAKTDAGEAIAITEAFRVVSYSYTPFDVDRVAEALRMAAPANAHGTVSYDGSRAKFEIVYHSDVDASEYVAGEVFKACVGVRTDDTGRGGLQVFAALYSNLCLNLIIIDRSVQQIDTLRHVGSVEALARKFREAFERAMACIQPFIVAWGEAAHEDVIARAVATEAMDGPLPIEVALPGFFSAMISRELVPVPLHGRKREEVVADLVTAWNADTTGAGPSSGMVTRAGLLNAFTRYAHEVEPDPFKGAEIEEAAGKLVAGKGGKKPSPLPWIPAAVKSAEAADLPME